MKSRARLIAAVEAAVRKLKAQRPSDGTLRPNAPATPPAAPAAHFGEHERLEESKYYPPAPSEASKLEEGELPDSYGKTRVVLLVVDPNMVHAYWEITPQQLQEAGGRIGDSSQPVLRFCGAGETFDVEVDLRPRNWYVPLWSSGKSYYVDLGLRGGDGSFVRLAQSNAVHIPRALPVIDVEERFMRVEEPGRRAEIIEPPPYRKPSRPPASLQPPAPVSPVVSAGAVPSGAGLASAPPTPSIAVPDIPQPGDSADILNRKLAEFFAFRHEPSPEKAPVAALNGARSDEHYPDLTELAERQQTLGLSSALLQRGRQER